MTSMRVLLPALTALIVATSACSALVDPDESRLGGDGVFDGGDGGGDGGGRDTGPSDSATDVDRPDVMPMCSAGCDDGIACTSDLCEDGRCEYTPDDSLCASQFCITGRVCDPSAGCLGGAPRDCDDGDPCTANACVEAAARCDSTPVDADGDGHPARSVASTSCESGTDCNDDDADINPDAAEVCDGIADEDCDGAIDEGCVPPPDDCGSAGPVALDDRGIGTITGTFAGLSDDFTPSALCPVTAAGRDAHHYVDIPAGTYDIEIDTIGSTIDTILSVAFECDPTSAATICNDDHDTAAGNASRVWIHRVSAAAPFRVHMIVDKAASGRGGRYTLNVHRRAAAPDRCISLSGAAQLDITGGGTVFGLISGISSERGSCQSFVSSRPEAIFTASSPTSGVMNLTAFSAEFTPDLYVRSGRCGTGTELTCVRGSSSGGVGFAVASVSPPAGSDEYIFLEGASGGYVLYYEPF